MKLATALLPLLLACGCGGASARSEPKVARSLAGEGFWDLWGDGRAEIDTYTLVTPRYGQLRSGSAVFVFVTEDFTDKQRVKSDGGHGDEYPVLKLNEIRHFQTGVYDYDLMTSVFMPLDGRSTLGLPAKVSFSAQEWCGHTYDQLIPREDSLQHTGHSYFDGEADHDDFLPIPSDAVLADALPILARGIAGRWPEPGTSASVSLFDRLMLSRFAHEPPRWRDATVRRSETPTVVQVPAGSFSCFEVEVELEGDGENPRWVWQIEAAAPHRIVKFTTSEGEVGELVASERIPYWQLNREGDERALSGLGLSILPGASPPPAAEAPTP